MPSCRILPGRRPNDMVALFLSIMAFVWSTNLLVVLTYSWRRSDGDTAADLGLHPYAAPSHHLRVPAAHDRGPRNAPHAHNGWSRPGTAHLIPRAFVPMTLPCFPAEHHWHRPHVLTSPTSTGFLFNKPFKTASSTTVGVHLRIATHEARRRLGWDQPSDDRHDHGICQTRFDHGFARDLFPDRDHQRSFLWTTLREPTSRAISMFFHFMVARHKVEPTDANMQAAMEHGAVMVQDYYLTILSTSYYQSRHKDTDPRAVAQAILDHEYDFIAITERLDESLVALQLLLGLPTADILYLSAKRRGNFDDGAGKKRCYYIWPSFVTPGMETYFASDHWQDLIQWDWALYQAANRSLDLTIERLGRTVFQQALERFQWAQTIAEERCLAQAIFPCSEGGIWRPPNETNCLWNDSGCGNDCLDRVSDELGLWEVTTNH